MKGEPSFHELQDTLIACDEQIHTYTWIESTTQAARLRFRQSRFPPDTAKN